MYLRAACSPPLVSTSSGQQLGDTRHFSRSNSVADGEGQDIQARVRVYQTCSPACSPGLNQIFRAHA